MSELSPGLSIVIPVYNSAAVLPALLARLAAVLESLGRPAEVILVNDGSRDESWQVVQDLAQQHRFVRGISMMRNYGQHNALLAGLRAARYDVTCTMDDDLQHPPEEMPRLLARLGPDCDVVYGTPIQEPHVFWRAAASRITKFALKSAMGSDIAGRVSAFRALRTKLRAAFVTYQSPFVSLDVLLTWATTRFATVAVPHHARVAGKSNYTFRQLVRHALTLMTGFSTWPLRVASWIGFSFTLFGLAILAYVVSCYLINGGSVPGFPFLASIVAIFSGAQLFALGIMGEYLARMHFRMMDRPTYVVGERTGHE